jgi:putative ABC transport system substrate-binding protein
MNLGRRDFITLLGGAAAWPLAARAQRPSALVIGYLSSSDPRVNQDASLSGFRQGLSEQGFVEGRNVSIEFRWAEGKYDRLPALAADLVSRKVAVINASTTPAARAAQAVTKTIPIVFGVAADPVAIGLVASLNRPGGNLTGTTAMNVELAPKKLELLHQMIPAAASIAFLIDPASPNAVALEREGRAAGQALGLRVHVAKASTDSDVDAVFAGLRGQGADALLLTTSPFLGSQIDRIISLAARYRVPVMCNRAEHVAIGCLISYSTSFRDEARHIGAYVGRILKGEKPADLPVLQPTKFDLAINLRTAKALGLTVPQTLLVTADEVLE